MQENVRSRILQATKAQQILQTEVIQPLWNDYGTLSRVFLRGGKQASVIVKHIKIPAQAGHPRGFVSTLSNDRKVRSYEVETHWYQHQNKRMPESSPTPRCLDAFAHGGELFLLLEDLAESGFQLVLRHVSRAEIDVVLSWLAHFHARFLGDAGDGLWPCGTYWHLDTRPEELEHIKGTQLHRFASLLDARLRCDAFPTLVHGDAKLANFLFRADRTDVAAVDFQYVGRGAAMKDVAYFIGSCLSGPDCERVESELLNVYFAALGPSLPDDVDAQALEAEWRALYPVAWADFERFMLGWNPGHRKLTDYSDSTTKRALKEIEGELMTAARDACLAAGRFIQENRDRPLEVKSKGFESQASDVVTEIDLQAQAMILKILEPTMVRYDLGVLAEEGEQDDSRLHKHAFWTIDPLDGTQCFIEGKSGYATSIALVSQSGEPILGVVYDPVHENLYEAVAGRGVTLNYAPLKSVDPVADNPGPPKWFADDSMRHHPHFHGYQSQFDIQFVGGAVMNCIQLLIHPNSVYIKEPKKALGGCAIWDLAAVTLMLRESGAHACHYDGNPAHLNRPESIFFNDVGLAYASADVSLETVLAPIKGTI
jgi:fructose-1,6-bisphosphatase/inositol monophosphatase family enzyme